MRNNVARWKLDPVLALGNLERRVLRTKQALLNWPAEDLSVTRRSRAAQLLRSYRRHSGRNDNGREQAAGLFEADALHRADVTIRICDRYHDALTIFAKSFSLSAGHVDATARCYDALDILGACEAARAWAPKRDHGLQYQRQLRQLAQKRRANDLAKSLRGSAQKLRRYALALNTASLTAIETAGLQINAETTEIPVAESWYWDPAFPDAPGTTRMLAKALDQIAAQVGARSRDPSQEFLRIGNLVRTGSNFPLPKMPRTGLAVELVQMLTEMVANPPGRWRDYSEFRSLDRVRRGVQRTHYTVAAAFVSAALAIHYSPAAASKAVNTLLSRSDSVAVTNWNEYEGFKDHDVLVGN